MSALNPPADVGTTIDLFEAKTHLSELVARARAGERITITKHGRPVALLVPPEPDVTERRAARERVRHWRTTFAQRGVLLTRDEIKAFIDEGRS